MFSVLVIALALLCAASALLLWRHSANKRMRAQAEQFVAQRFEGSVSPLARVTHAPQTLRRTVWEEILIRAGMSRSKTPLFVLCGASVALCLWVGAYLGWAAAVGTLAVALALAFFYVVTRAHRRCARIVRQLPSFLDGIVRLITLGNSVPAAFQAALKTTETPLRECLERAARMTQGGIDLDRALYLAAKMYRVREFELLGAILRLSMQYGGRADVVLDRMSAFMRDLEQAERELTALSAETRLSACVLVLLPPLLGGFIVVTSPHYFDIMWADDGGRQLVYLAFALQVIGGYLLYRLTRLR